MGKGVPKFVHVIGIIIVLLIIEVAIASRLIPFQANEETQFQADGIPGDNSVTMQLVKEMRLSLADMMWLKTEEYIHDGVQHRRGDKDREDGDFVNELESESHGESDEYEEQSHGLKHDHGGTLIPKKEDDFRGILGDIQRQTQPYMRKHWVGRNLEELLPWLRLTTLANPHHIAAHRATAFFLASYMKRPALAIESIKDALKLNPGNPQLLVALGRLHFYDRKDPGKAKEVFGQVIDSWERRRDKWSEDDEFAARQAYLHMGYCMETLKDPEGAVKWARRGLKQFPDFRPLSRLIKRVRSRGNDRYDLKKDNGDSIILLD